MVQHLSSMTGTLLKCGFCAEVQVSLLSALPRWAGVQKSPVVALLNASQFTKQSPLTMDSLVCQDFTVSLCQRTSGDVIRPGLSRIPALIFSEWRMGKDFIITKLSFRHSIQSQNSGKRTHISHLHTKASTERK